MASVQHIFYKNSSIPTLVDDFWDDIFARPIVKYGVSIFTLWTLLCLIPFFCISMNFIFSKHYRTMVSYGEALMCFCGIYVMIGIIIFCVPRLLLGPLPEAVCWYQKFFNQSAPITTMLVFDAYYLARVSSTFLMGKTGNYSLVFSTFMWWFSRQQPFAMKISWAFTPSFSLYFWALFLPVFIPCLQENGV